MTNDGLSSVALGREGTGEAVLIKGSPASELAKIYAQDYKLKEAKKAKEAKDIADLTGDVPVAKWTAGNFNYYGPALNNWRAKAPKIMAAIQNEADPYKKAALKREYEQEGINLKRSVEIDNQTFENWGKEIANKRSNPGNYSDEVEIDGKVIPYDQAEKIYADPVGSGLGKEVEQAGSLAMWRVNNFDKYKPQLSYDRNKDLNEEVNKVKKDKWYSKEVKNIGGAKVVDIYEGVPEDRVESEHETFWSRSDNKGKKWRKSAADEASKYVSISDKGKEMVLPTPIPGQPLVVPASKIMTVGLDAPSYVMDAVEKINSEKNLSIEEKIKRLPKEISFQEYKSKLPKSATPHFLPKGDIFNFGDGGATGVGDIMDMDKSVSRMYGDERKTNIVKGKGFQYDPVDVTIQTPEVLFNSETGEPIKDSEVRNIKFGEFQVVPVLQDNYKLPNGVVENKGSILTQELTNNPAVVENLAKKGLLKYEIVGYGTNMKAEGSGAPPTKESFYTRLSNIQGRLTSGGDKKSMALKKRIQDLQRLADEQNASINQTSALAQKLKDRFKKKTN
jgi:hypothetical protein